MGKSAPNSNLIGKYVYIVEDKSICREGQIINLIANQYCLIRMFSAMTGESNVEILVNLSELCNGNYYICDDETAKMVAEDYGKHRVFRYPVKRFNSEKYNG